MERRDFSSHNFLTNQSWIWRQLSSAAFCGQQNIEWLQQQTVGGGGRLAFDKNAKPINPNFSAQKVHKKELSRNENSSSFDNTNSPINHPKKFYMVIN